MAGVDLQIHTTFSDGRNTPSEIVSMALEHKVAVIAITDHDNLGGIAPAQEAAKGTDLIIIPGVEVTTTFHGKSCHILGYGIDPLNTQLKLFLDPIYHYRRESMLTKLEFLNTDFRAAGKPTVDIELFQKENGPFYNNPMTGKYLADKGFVANQDEGAELLRTIATSKLDVSPKEAIDAIHAAGGVAVVSHPFAPKLSFKNITKIRDEQEKLLIELKVMGLDGIECYQSGYNEEDTALALSLAKKHALLVAGGSDWHGPVSVLGEEIRTFIPFYPEHLGALSITTEQVAPLLSRLGIKVDKT